MTSEKGNFRTNLMGGFNKTDVVEYITELAAELNKYKKEAAENAEKLESLTTEKEALEVKVGELENTIKEGELQEDKIKESAKRRAFELISGIEKKYGDICAQIDENTTRIKSELAGLTSGIDRISEEVEETSQRFEDLHREYCSEDNEAPKEEN